MSRMDEQRPRAVVICGPTASGKSRASDRTAADLTESGDRGEVPAIVVDSMQVYRELPVVTNQYRERAAELTGVVPVSEDWTVARHREAAESVIRKTPGPFVLDAGTGMYLNAIILEIDLAPKVPEKVRAEAERRAGEEGNPRREARKLELELTGAGERSSIWEGSLRYPTAVLYIRPRRDELDRNVAGRSRKIAREGAEEVREVLRRWRESGIEPNDSVKQSIGFREMAAYVNGEATLDWAEQRLNTRTRRLARRQMRWFDKLCEQLPAEAGVTVAESPDEEKAVSYMRGIIETWK